MFETKYTNTNLGGGLKKNAYKNDFSAKRGQQNCFSGPPGGGGGWAGGMFAR